MALFCVDVVRQMTIYRVVPAPPIADLLVCNVSQLAGIGCLLRDTTDHRRTAASDKASDRTQGPRSRQQPEQNHVQDLKVM